MEDVQLPDLSKTRESDKRELPPQTSAEDTSNWDNRAIALPDAHSRHAVFITNKTPDLAVDLDLTVNPYIEQERLKSVKRKK
jgi:hypothetical protein